MEESIKARGDVTITLIDTKGKVVETIEHRNLIVNVGKTLLAHRLAGDATYSTDGIATIGFGSGTVTPAVTDTQLTTSNVTKAVTATYPAYNSVMFTATMTESEGNAVVFKELGLFSGNASPKMFSHLAINPITKSSSYQIRVDWTISFQ